MPEFEVDYIEDLDQVDVTDQPESMERRAILALPILSVVLGGCAKIEQLLKGKPKPPEPRPAPPQRKTQPRPPESISDPNRPEFLDQNNVKTTGLTFMMANNDLFDRYIFNAVTGNHSHAQTYRIQKGYNFEYEDGREYEMPYHAFLFKAFDERSNLRLPKRLGKRSKNRGIADFFRNYTIYRADNPKHIEAIKTILITSYELSFGVKLDPSHIKIEGDAKGRLGAIKYTAPLSTATTIANKTVKDENNSESRNIIDSKKKRWNLVGRDGELFFPPTIMVDQGIALPFSAMLKYPTVKYSKTFDTQGKRMTINMNIPIDEVMNEQEKLRGQGRPTMYLMREGLETSNFGYYVLENDSLVNELAELITEGFTTKREKMQAILDFIHSYDYVPDAYGEAPRTPRITLLSNGGDCEDSSILLVSLARAVGIDCIFAYFEGHAAPLCDIGEEGTAISWGGKYEWCETTGGNHGVITVTNYLDERGRVVERKRDKRGWAIGEKSEKIGPIKFVSRVEDERLTRVN